MFKTFLAMLASLALTATLEVGYWISNGVRLQLLIASGSGGVASLHTPLTVAAK